MSLQNYKFQPILKYGTEYFDLYSSSINQER